MNFTNLTDSYWKSQIERIEKARQEINNRLNITSGYTIPSDTALSIGTGKRVDAAIMFLDISDFSSRSSETKKRQMDNLAVLNLFFSEMIKIAEDYGGTVEKNTGDGLMAYFEDGTSDPPENGPHRALASALTMFAATDSLINPILINSQKAPIKFRICIDYGTITIAKLGAPRRFNSIVAIGTTANIASKMLSFAKPGQILLGEDAKNKIPPFWQLKWTELHTLYTGWIRTLSKEPYPFYLYTGRWTGFE